MPEITFLPHNRKIKTAEDQNLLRAAMEAGVHVNASCGGQGACGKCRVILEKGEIEGGTSEKLSREDREKGYFLACRAKALTDLTVRIPVESQMDSSLLKDQQLTRRTARVQQMDFNELKEKGLFIPPVEKKYLELPHRQDRL